ncbi:hypothetical protein A5649_02665 [Mycolicibacter heraklionensis]|uniref:Helix-turn-helix domain-containing protein n=1 Tax=Mycolicibacter heraklionensis TaxID=512402 RepID=A0AA91IY22_9MYCO|nr:hypothetical protein [Mycolicibacter heraklionensis]OBK85266.1 hypothetical protein A5649_02665 [Mycolicibacter heraklionensis]
MNDWKSTGARLGGLSRSTVFELWRTAALGSVKVGRRRFSTDQQIAVYIAGLEAASATGGDAA